METYTVAFFGHRYINNPLQIESCLEMIVQRMIDEKSYIKFLVGRNGDFDQYVSSAMLRVKKKYRDDNSSLVLVLPYPTTEYQNNAEAFEKYYDEIEICQTSAKAYFKSAIQMRNRIMVDRADLVVCYIDHPSGGAYQTFQYAKRQNKQIMNLTQIIINAQ